MKRSASLSVLAAAFAAVLCAATAAQAFTFEDQGSVANGDGTRSAIADPGSNAARFGSNSGSTSGPGVQPGKSGIYFGPSARPSDQRYYPNHLFDPLGRPGDTR